jgi:hypothetical protein
VVGIAASLALADRILGDDTDGGRQYLDFLKAGLSRSPAELLQAAGVDLGSPEPVLRAVRAYDRLLDQLEALHDRQRKQPPSPQRPNCDPVALGTQECSKIYCSPACFWS